MSEASLDLDAVARLLHVTPSTVRRWLRQGLLHPSAPGGRFARAQLEDWARRRGLSLGQSERAEVRHPADLLADAFERGCGALAFTFLADLGPTLAAGDDDRCTLLTTLLS